MMIVEQNNVIELKLYESIEIYQKTVRNSKWYFLKIQSWTTENTSAAYAADGATVCKTCENF